MQNDKGLTETNCVVDSELLSGSVLERTDRVVTGNGSNKDPLLSSRDLHYRCRLLGGYCYCTAQKFQHGKGGLETCSKNLRRVE